MYVCRLGNMRRHVKRLTQASGAGQFDRIGVHEWGRVIWLWLLLLLSLIQADVEETPAVVYHLGHRIPPIQGGDIRRKELSRAFPDCHLTKVLIHGNIPSSSRELLCRVSVEMVEHNECEENPRASEREGLRL
jgi:hypothetical protein